MCSPGHLRRCPKGVSMDPRIPDPRIPGSWGPPKPPKYPILGGLGPPLDRVYGGCGDPYTTSPNNIGAVGGVRDTPCHPWVRTSQKGCQKGSPPSMLYFPSTPDP